MSCTQVLLEVRPRAGNRPGRTLRQSPLRDGLATSVAVVGGVEDLGDLRLGGFAHLAHEWFMLARPGGVCASRRSSTTRDATGGGTGRYRPGPRTRRGRWRPERRRRTG